MLEAELPQKIADNTDHRVVIVDDQNRYRGIDSHGDVPETGLPLEVAEGTRRH
jgi:CBS-domain-containing membrane protein